MTHSATHSPTEKDAPQSRTQTKSAPTNTVAIKRALISVSDKTGIVDFARGLSSLGVEILSTGGTYKKLIANEVPAIEIADYTGFPEMMAGRVKTLHPKVHGGILARRGTDDAVLAENQIPTIDMVIVNLYPFQKTVARDDCLFADAIENIDIGGPTMVRAAAKNHRDVAIIVDPNAYPEVLDEMKASKGQISGETRFQLALSAFEHTAAYDGAIANYLGSQTDEEAVFPRTLNLQFHKASSMRYGENPHQRAAFYRERDHQEASVATAHQRQGKALSYNNVADTDAALETVKLFSEPSCVIVKHANPCGVAVDKDITNAYENAFSTDPESAFGGIIAFNRELDEHTAKLIVGRQFVEVIIAPSASEGALKVTSEKKNLRILTCGEWQNSAASGSQMDYKRVNGGLLVQDSDKGCVDASDLKVVTERAPTEAETRDLLFAWKVAKMVKSNAIVYARDNRTIGVGAGQMSRVNSARIAAIKAESAELEVKGSVMASDAFFPFRDGIDQAAATGIRAVIQPGGSMRDDEVITAANEHGIAMVFTGMRHFRH